MRIIDIHDPLANACLIVLRISHIHRPQKMIPNTVVEAISKSLTRKKGSKWFVMQCSLGF